MNHEESKLQKDCVSWFRAQYPQYAMLLVHQKMFETADYMYVVVKGLDEFRHIMNCYIEMATQWMRRKVAAAHVEIVKAAEDREKEKFYKIIGKK